MSKLNLEHQIITTTYNTEQIPRSMDIGLAEIVYPVCDNDLDRSLVCRYSLIYTCMSLVLLFTKV